MVKKTDYDIKITEIENEIPDNINLTKKTDFNKKPGNISNRVTSSKKKKQVEIGKTLNDHQGLLIM